jgi:hypothetical protein
MERLFFVCPKTARTVDSRIETDLGTLLRIKTETIEMMCPICGERHEWPISDAHLAKAA